MLFIGIQEEEQGAKGGKCYSWSRCKRGRACFRCCSHFCVVQWHIHRKSSLLVLWLSCVISVCNICFRFDCSMWLIFLEEKPSFASLVGENYFLSWNMSLTMWTFVWTKPYSIESHCVDNCLMTKICAINCLAFYIWDMYFAMIFFYFIFFVIFPLRVFAGLASSTTCKWLW